MLFISYIKEAIEFLFLCNPQHMVSAAVELSKGEFVFVAIYIYIYLCVCIPVCVCVCV